MSKALMSQKYPGAAATYDAAMSFEEIGRELGIPKQAAYFLFVSALKKLRAKPSRLAGLRELVELRETERSRRGPHLPDCAE